MGVKVIKVIFKVKVVGERPWSYDSNHNDSYDSYMVDTKRTMGSCGRAHPSFGMTPTF